MDLKNIFASIISVISIVIALLLLLFTISRLISKKNGFKDFYKMQMCSLACAFMSGMLGVVLYHLFPNLFNYSFIIFILTYHGFIFFSIFTVIILIFWCVSIIDSQIIPWLKTKRFFPKSIDKDNFFLIPSDLTIDFSIDEQRYKLINNILILSYVISILFIVSPLRFTFQSFTTTPEELELIKEDFKSYSQIFIFSILPILYAYFKKSK